MKILTQFNLLILLVISQLSIYAQEINVLPDTPEGQIVSAYFDAFNSDDEAGYRTFITTKRLPSYIKKKSVEERLKDLQRMKQMIPQFELKKVVKNDPKAITVLAYSPPTDGWFKVVFTFTDEQPTLLKSIMMRPIGAPNTSNNPSFGKWETLTDLLSNVVEKTGIPGMSMVTVVDGKIDQVAISGVRKVGAQDLIEQTDRFHVGSVTKSMTATIIGRLIDDKLLTPKTTLQAIFPKIDMLPTYQSVTIEQLLQHTAGIPAYLTITDKEEKMLLSLPGNPTEQRLAFAKYVLQQSPTTKPGASWSYSNAGYSILGAISERVTSKLWEGLLQEYIFEPLKMKSAGTGWPNEASPEEPTGHFGSLNDLQSQEIGEYVLGAYLDPAGDVHCSMEDLARFAIAHLNGVNGQSSILTSETFQLLHQPDKESDYAAGWFIQRNDSGIVVHEHPGSAGTFYTYMAIEPETNRAWVISANAADMKIDGIFREIISVYRSKK